MSKRRRRRATRRRATAQKTVDQIMLEKPTGLATVPVLEEFAEVGRVDKLRRWRNTGEHPLDLAFAKGRLDGTGKNPRENEAIGKRRYAAGEWFRQKYEVTMKPGRSSMEPAIGGASPTARTTLADAMIDGSRFIARIRDAMGETATFRIIEAFCGQGYPMVDALRLADVPFAPQGVLPRILESLDVLARVMSKPLPPSRPNPTP